jgi:predicted phosphoribosyltransferase
MVGHKNSSPSGVGVAHLLIENLRHLSNTNPIVVGLSKGSALLGKHISSFFHTSLEMISCKQINHPSQKDATIGSVTETDAVLTNNISDIPHDFISHQIILHQHACRFERAQYARLLPSGCLKDRVVIVVADEVADANSALAAIEVVRKQNPQHIAFAVGYISQPALKALSSLVNEVVYLGMILIS